MKLNNVHPSLIKAPDYNYIHVFTDRKDEFFCTKDSYSDALLKALKLKNTWLKEGFKNIRIYYCEEYTDLQTAKIIQDKEELLLAIGDYPQ